MFELNLIETTDKSELTKEKFMTFLGDDFSNYAQLLSQSLSATKESHLIIFEQLKEKAEKQWNTVLNKKPKK